MINMLTITRIHYSIDVIGALIFAPFWYFFIDKHLKQADYSFSGFFYLSRKIYKKCKRFSYYKYASETHFDIKSDGANNTPIVRSHKEIDVKIDMNDEITNSNDFPYLNGQIEDLAKSIVHSPN